MGVGWFARQIQKQIQFDPADLFSQDQQTQSEDERIFSKVSTGWSTISSKRSER